MLLTTVTTRIASLLDASLIADMSRETFYESFAADNTKENMDKFMNERFTRELLMAEVGAPNNIFLVANFRGMPAGYVRLREDNNPPELQGLATMEIARIYSKKEFIGKGVGKALMERSIEVAKERGKQLIWLGVWEKNLLAINFYTKWGFSKFSEHPFVLGDDLQTDWLLKKTL
jgi:ribosomal protein S18 acetylase RimI-like enzyme